MSKQDGVILDSIVYEKVSKAVNDLQRKAENPETWQFDIYSDSRVIWESKNHYHSTTRYAITGFGAELGEPTLQIRVTEVEKRVVTTRLAQTE